jgi:hypothetical protein
MRKSDGRKGACPESENPLPLAKFWPRRQYCAASDVGDSTAIRPPTTRSPNARPRSPHSNRPNTTRDPPRLSTACNSLRTSRAYMGFAVLPIETQGPARRPPVAVRTRPRRATKAPEARLLRGREPGTSRPRLGPTSPRCRTPSQGRAPRRPRPRRRKMFERGMKSHASPRAWFSSLAKTSADTSGFTLDISARDSDSTTARTDRRRRSTRRTRLVRPSRSAGGLELVHDPPHRRAGRHRVDFGSHRAQRAT